MALPFAGGDPLSVGVEDDVAFVAAPAGSRAGQQRGGEGGVGSARLVRLGATMVPALVLLVVASACTGSSTPPVAVTQPSETAASPPTTTTSTDVNTSTTVTTEATTTTDPAPSTTRVEPPVFSYAVVAEERASRLAVLDPTDPCLSTADECELTPVMTVDLPDRPHNLTGSGTVVYATHPAAGTVSGVDLSTGAILTVEVGTEPHDVIYSGVAGVLYVADEAGRRLLAVDPDTLGIVETVDLPAEPHDLALAGDVIWVTLIGRHELARVTGTDLELFPTSGSPHDLVIDEDGLVWFSNWGSDVLNVFDPADGSTAVALAGVMEPHHFAIAPDGTVWVSDNGGSAIVGFSTETVRVDVGPVPHHLAFVGDTAVVAVSGSGAAALVRDGRIVGSSQLSPGLHGVAIVEIPQPLAP